MNCRCLTCATFLIGAMLLFMRPLSLDAQSVESNPFGLIADHSTVSVSDWDAQCNWYKRVLGFSDRIPAKTSPDKKICYLGIPGYRLDVLWQNGSARHRQSSGGLEQGWLNLEFHAGDLNALYVHLQTQGIAVKVDRSDSGMLKHLKFEDPEGNEIGITL